MLRMDDELIAGNDNDLFDGKLNDFYPDINSNFKSEVITNDQQENDFLNQLEAVDVDDEEFIPSLETDEKFAKKRKRNNLLTSTAFRQQYIFLHLKDCDIPTEKKLVPPNAVFTYEGKKVFVNDMEVITVGRMYTLNQNKKQNYFFSDNGEPVPAEKLTDDVIQCRKLDGKSFITEDAFNRRNFSFVGGDHRKLTSEENKKIMFNPKDGRLYLGTEEVVWNKKRKRASRTMKISETPMDSDIPVQCSEVFNLALPGVTLSLAAPVNSYLLERVKKHLSEIENICKQDQSFYQKVYAQHSTPTMFLSPMQQMMKPSGVMNWLGTNNTENNSEIDPAFSAKH